MQTHEELMTEEEFDVFWNILGGEPAPANANPNIVTEANAFRGGLLAALQTPPPKRVVVKLAQWLQGQFTETITAGWRTLEEMFRQGFFCKQYAFMGTVVIKRAKPIHLTADLTVALILELKKMANQEINVVLRVLATGDKPYLPEHLKLTVISESEESLDVVAGPEHDYLEQEWLYETGEQFRVRLTWNDIQVTEYFTV
ncbi:MAG: hypothetical protein DRR19_16685 [Candidatus Parabeggiatoa sp. nov. 1]|nr:MAG: hypothetical protein DRR19_16685 [Gammaproteobacteria bacterium]